jgi:hypothetical protein
VSARRPLIALTAARGVRSVYVGPVVVDWRRTLLV